MKKWRLRLKEFLILIFGKKRNNMQKIILKPLEGIEIENVGEIKFGQTRAEVVSTLNNPDNEEDNRLFYDDFELSIEFNKQGKVEFIEVYGPDCENIAPSIYGIKPFEIPAQQLVTLLTSKNSGKVDDTEAPHGYCFLGSSVGIWRELTEKEAKEDIEQAKKDGEYEEWMEEEVENSKYFWTIGLGEKDYYKF